MLLKQVLIGFAAGYILCVIAKKQEGLLRTLGYTLGISTMVLVFIYGLLASQPCCPTKLDKMMGCKYMMCEKGMHTKCHPMMKR